jgi:hypothetical protein
MPTLRRGVSPGLTQSSNRERAPGYSPGHLAQHAGFDEPVAEIEPGADGDIEGAAEQPAGERVLSG